jgi:hypothetical protein
MTESRQPHQPQPRRIWVDRSRTVDRDRCQRLRYLAYHAGSEHRGLAPVRKSIHLVLGGAVHAGLEVLLREGQREIYHIATNMTGPNSSIAEQLEVLFVTSRGPGQITFARNIENMAVVAALTELAEASAHGVDLDDMERLEQQQAALAAGSGLAGFDDWDRATGQFKQPTSGAEAEPILEITFDQPAFAQVCPDAASLTRQLEASLALLGAVQMDQPAALAANTTSEVDWATPVYETETQAQAQAAEKATVAAQASAMQASGIDTYLKEELAAQVEAMVRAYARRRWRGVLAEFEVLEVEREGEWKLGEVPGTGGLGDAELWFASRADALLRNRETSDLYIMSYKTTGAWDRRKAADAEVDMQGLSEAVDIERRLGEAWLHIHAGHASVAEGYDAVQTVNQSTWNWLCTLPEPPRVLGVRYEYLVKGPRRKDKNDPAMPNRFVADTPLIRAYKFDGITADDRRWAHSFTFHTQAGKSSRLDYRAWKKAPVWKFMPVSRWIDMLDAGEIQPDIYDEHGREIDILAEQFIPPVVVYRNDDDMRDMLEQLEASEIRVAENVAAVQAAERQGDLALVRSELNRRFPQTRTSCSWPGACAMRPICFGPQTIRQNPESSELYQVRRANHPQETREDEGGEV